MSAPVRVAVCDDSRTYAHALTRALEGEGDIEVVGRFETAEQLLAVLPAERVDLVTMDLELPGMDGVEATRRIMAARPLPVLVLSSHTGRGSERAAEALAAGAVDALHKGDVPLSDVSGPGGAALRRRVRRLSRLRPVPPALVRRTAAVGVAASPALEAAAARGVRAIAIGASTGGPSALRDVLGALPPDPSVPVLVVQHISAGFADGLVRWLDGQVPPPVRLATHGAPATAGVWVAPDDAHLVVEPAMRLGLDRRERAAAHPHRPSADALLGSLARHVGTGAVAAVLTGMGADGAEGVRAVVGAGGLAIAQSPATSVVGGMPTAALAAGAQVELDLGDVGPALATLARPKGPA